MVGVASTNDEPDIEVVEPLAALEAKADAQLADQQMIGWEMLDFRIVAGAAPALQSQHVRFRVRFLVIAADAAATVIITIGTRTFNFPVAVGTIVIPFPVVIERGVDSNASVSAGAANVTVLVIGSPE
jgi:hypothetical protein